MVAQLVYDSIGERYREGLREAPRIAAAVLAALGDASPVVNVGAGAGSYEPRDRPVVAVDPSARHVSAASRSRLRRMAPQMGALAPA